MTKTYRFELSKRAKTDLAKLEKQLASRVVAKLEFYVRTYNPLVFAKRLKDREMGDYRFRVGNYRVLFDVDDQGRIVILMILAVKHRREAYLD